MGAAATLCVSTDLFGQAATGLEVSEQALDFSIAIEAVEFFGDVVSKQLHFSGGRGFLVGDAFLHAVEGGTLGIVADGHLRLGGFVQSNATAMARKKDFALGLGF